MSELDPLELSTDDLAELCGVPVNTVREWRRTGTGPVGYRVGKYVRYAKRDVAAWLAERRDDRPAAAAH